MQGPAASAPSAALEAPLEAALKNVKDQAVGPGTLAEVGLPEPYLRRVAEHVLRASFEDNFRIVVEDAHAATSPSAAASSSQATSASTQVASAHAAQADAAQDGSSAMWAVLVAVVLLLVAGALVLRRKS